MNWALIGVILLTLAAAVLESVSKPLPLTCWMAWAKVFRSYSAPELIVSGLEFGSALRAEANASATPGSG